MRDPVRRRGFREALSLAALILLNGAACGGGRGTTASAGSGGSPIDAASSSGGSGGGGASGPGTGGGSGGAAGSGGGAGRGVGGADGGAAGTGSNCPGVPSFSGPLCRTLNDCSHGSTCTSDPTGVLSACGGFCIAPPPRHDCSIDTDCPSGEVCISSATPCCNMISTVCQPACTSASCSSTQRCNAAGRCEPFPCTDGYTCPVGSFCYASATGADANGCAPLPCSHVGCPVDSVCQPTAATGGCSPKKCSVDGDCDCGFCVGGTCATRLSACVIPPS